jgi:hypothetical protein
LKGEERVCHVTEADRPRGLAVSLSAKRSFACREARADLRQAYPRKCLHARPLCAGRMSSGLMPLGGLAPVRGGVTASSGDEDAGIKRKEGHLVDALALRGDEGRGTLRKARGRCERSVIPGGYPVLNS